ncbi:DUF1329 domain-containing protein [Variovorax sp. J22P240]|uniref:DUF1329 domain-containing protein n=1 Tax=unclassified Variovorax TaxID=663243 RepID=UPI002577DD02|nr:MULTISPECIES: DUF1329 domain-containing protein [unclassified Variovorax]MDL9997502.1 DUF1329 domain-containing protein [Variovorax sp. J22P240]MDM0051538.1 DUF1329 domain-containing protein [Variovorax sp. J22R115]
MNISRQLLAGLVAASTGLAAHAALSADEAKTLGATLTPVGAEKGANKDGTIPAYTGGLTSAPAGFKAGDGVRPNPFAGEKPRLVVDAKNMAEHADRLTEGTKALLQKYPSFRVDVYPTHRSVAFPKFVTDNTAKGAVNAKTTNDGRSIEGVHAGFPFPIPKDGYEAMWNHLVRFNGQSYEAKYRNLNVDANGRPVLATEGVSVQDYPFWDTAKQDADTFWRIKLSYTGPARRAGEALMIVDPLDIGQKDRRAWSYLPGQRRVKVAPDLSYDTPNPGTAGATTFDDTFIFNGSMDRFDFKLVGKKEMYVPYNAYEAVYQAKQDDLLKPNHLNPDLVRWELHRVWVVEAKLRDGKRHVYGKRTFYLDEDSWAALASDNYDARGQMYRAGFAYMAPSYDLPAPYTDMFGHYDLVARVYSLTGFIAETGGMRYTKPMSDRDWTPDSLAGSGIR